MKIFLRILICITCVHPLTKFLCFFYSMNRTLKSTKYEDENMGLWKILHFTRYCNIYWMCMNVYVFYTNLQYPHYFHNFSNIKPLAVIVVGDNFLNRFFSYRIFKYNHLTKLRLVMIYENCRYNFYDSSSFVYCLIMVNTLRIEGHASFCNKFVVKMWRYCI